MSGYHTKANTPLASTITPFIRAVAITQRSIDAAREAHHPAITPLDHHAPRLSHG